MKIESWENYRLVYVDNWWDWELSGIAQKQGRRVYFDCIEDNGFHRKFAIYDPPIEIWTIIDARKADFIAHVGNHWEFVETSDGYCRKGKLHPQSEWYKFYDKWRNNKIMMLPEWQISIADSGIDKYGVAIPISDDE